MAVGRAVLGSVGAMIPGAIDGWLASNDVNNAANPSTTEAPDPGWRSQSGVFKGILMGAEVINILAGGPTFAMIGFGLTARQAAFHFAEKGQPTPVPSQG